jgi:hypothetical protein
MNEHLHRPDSVEDSSEHTASAINDTTLSPEEPPPGVPKAVPVPQPLWTHILQSLAFAFSALLSPYLVIPVGTVIIVATQSEGRRDFILWTAISVLSSTVIPALYVLYQIWQGKITDVHVMEREQRGGPFIVAVVSAALGAVVLKFIGAPSVVWGVGVVLLLNGLVLSWITKFWKISMHVAVLSATVYAMLVFVKDVSAWTLLWMIPALMWARSVRGRHSLWQGIAGCAVACITSGIAFYSVNLWGMVISAFNRIMPN